MIDSQNTTFSGNLIKNLHLDENLSEQFEALKALIFNTPDSRQTKIDVLKESLEAGRYTIHAQHLAEKMLNIEPLAETQQKEALLEEC